MLNYVVLSLSLAMGALCVPVFHYSAPSANGQKLVAEGRNHTRISLRRNTTKSIFQQTNPSSESLDGYSQNSDGWNYHVIDAIINRRYWSRFEPNFLQQAVEILNLHSLMNVSAKNQELREPSAHRNSRPLITNNKSSSASGQHRRYSEFFDNFVFSGSNVGAFFQHVQTMSAARYRPLPEETSLQDSTKNATHTIDMLTVLKKRKKRRLSNRENVASFLRRQKRETDILFAESYYPETPEDIVKRVLKRRDENQEAEEGEEDRPKRAGTNSAKMVQTSAYSSLPAKFALIPQGFKKVLVSMLNKTRKFLTNEPRAKAATNDTAKLFVYNLTVLHKYYKLYYECLAIKKNWYLESVGNPMLNVQHILTSSSEQVTLKCHACLPPLAVAKSYGVRWMRRLLAKGGFEEVPKNEEEEENFAIDDDGHLVIQGIVLEDAGMYTCFKNGAHEITYFVGVENNVDRRRVFESGGGAKPAKPEILSVNNLYLFTEWSDWSPCNMCNRRGQRKRVGMCMIKKYDSKVPVRPMEVSILRTSPNGVPCRSAILPPFIAEMDRVKNRSSEFMIGYCYVECTTIPAITTVTDLDGNVVEIVLTGKGRKSLRGTPPPIPKDIVRETFYVDMYRRITLECPTEDDSSIVPIRWQNGSQILDEMTINDETKGRVYIDYNNKLVIKSAWLYDRGVYSCWHNLVRIAIIRLEVATPIDVTVLSVFSGFCFVFFVLMVVRLGVHLARFSSEQSISKVFRGGGK